MRREQVLKICLNHYITPQIMSNFKEKDAKSWRWAAPDFSEGELEDMMFAIRYFVFVVLVTQLLFNLGMSERSHILKHFFLFSKNNKLAWNRLIISVLNLKAIRYLY